MIVKEIHTILQNYIISKHVSYHCTFKLYTLRKFIIDHF